MRFSRIKKRFEFLRKRWFFYFFPSFLLIGGVLAAFLFLRQPLPLEEKFVVEKAPAPLELPAGEMTAPSDGVISEPGQQALLPGTRVSYQTFNNCGPANLAMILSYYGISKSQKELGEQIRPYQHPQGDNDDKTVFPKEFVAAVESFGLKALHRPNGSIELLKLFLSHEIPVVVKTLLKTSEDSAHFRIVRGFDEEKQVIIIDDSYFGPNKKIHYFEFLEMWQPFNYLYIPVYREDKEAIVKAILGQEIDETVAYWRAVNRAQKEKEKDRENVWPRFNLSNSYYHVGQLEKCVSEFEEIEFQLPRRALWYQTEPILAYQELGNYDRAFQIIERILNDNNLAFSELYQIRGEIYLEQGNKEAARKEFESALKYNQYFQPAKEALSRL